MNPSVGNAVYVRLEMNGNRVRQVGMYIDRPHAAPLLHHL